MRRRFGTLLLIFCIILNCIGASSAVFADDPVKTEYKSLDDFTTIFSGGTSDVWSAKVLRGDVADRMTFADFYGPVTPAASADNTALKIDEGTTDLGKRADSNGDNIPMYGSAGWSSGSVNHWTNFTSYAAITKDWMRPNSSSNANSSVAKVFTAPRTGYVKLSTEDYFGDERIWGRRATKDTSGAKIYIIKTAKNVSPTVDQFESSSIYSYKFTFTNTTDAWYAQATDFKPMYVKLAEDEKLWFIVNANDSVTGNAKFVHWNPIVTYQDTDVYNSYYDLTFDIKGDMETSGVWSWMGIETTGALAPMTTIDIGGPNGSGNLNFGNVTQADTADYFKSRAGANIINYLTTQADPDKNDAGQGGTASMSKFWMRPTIKDDGAAASSVAKVFTAPKTGLVTITAEDINGYAKIWARRLGNASTDTDGAQLYIMRVKASDTAQPAYADFAGNKVYAQKITFGDDASTAGDFAQAMDFEPISVALSKGDKLYFIVNEANIKHQQAKYVHWNPVVTYERDIAENDKTIHCSNSGSAEPDGTTGNPYTFAQALNVAGDGYTIVLDDHIGDLPDNVWSGWNAEDKQITIKGATAATKLDWTGINTRNMQIRCGVTFDNLVFSYTGLENSTNVITANFNKLVINNTVTSDNHRFKLFGGSYGTVSGSTDVTVNGGNFMEIYGGNNDTDQIGDCRLVIGGNTNYLYEEGKEEYEETDFAPVVFGGNFRSLTGKIDITVEDNAKIHKLHGGNTSKNETYPAYVTGAVTMDIKGGTIMNAFATGCMDKGVAEEDRHSLNATVNMTGGNVEMLAVSEDSSVKGNIVFNYLGGEVTRRIYAGCYNDYKTVGGYETDHFVDGNVTVVIGKDASTEFSKVEPVLENDKGIAGSSRHNTSHPEEISKIIFLDGRYDDFSDKLYSTFVETPADYLVAVAADGKVSGEIAKKDNTAIIGMYDSNNMLIGVDALTPTAARNTFALDNSALTKGSKYTIREMIWENLNTIKPMVDNINTITEITG